MSSSKFLLSSLLFFTFLISTQAAKSITPKPHILHQPPKIQDTIKPLIEQVSSTCSYTVKITTSCSSTRFTRDQISLAFSDAYGQQVYAPRLDDPSSGAFESCSSDTYQISGPCMSHICSLYLIRTGSDGWKPESVTVSGYYTTTVTYYYNTWLPNNVWYGFNHCNSQSRVSSGSLLLILCILVFVLCVGGAI